MNRNGALRVMMFSTILGLIVSMIILSGCMHLQKKVNTSAIVSKTDMFYEMIHVVMSEPEVRALIKTDTLQDLAKIDKIYQQARKQVSDDTEVELIEVLLNCGVSACDILMALDVLEDKKKEITAIRLGVKLLLATIKNRALHVQRDAIVLLG